MTGNGRFSESPDERRAVIASPALVVKLTPASPTNSHAPHLRGISLAISRPRAGRRLCLSGPPFSKHPRTHPLRLSTSPCATCDRAEHCGRVRCRDVASRWGMPVG